MIKPAQSYEQAIEFLFERINFERTPAADKQDFKLSRMRPTLGVSRPPTEPLADGPYRGNKRKGFDRDHAHRDA